jgi:hypothetical protein
MKACAYRPFVAPADPDATRWLIGTVEWDEDIATLRVRAECAHLLDQRPHRLRLTAQLDTTREDGRPDPAEGARLADLQDALEASIAGRAVLVALVTIPNRKHLFFYGGDSSWMRDWALAQRKAYPDRAFGMRLTEDPEWTFYAKVERDARLANADRIVMDKIVEQGADLRQPRDLEFFLYFPTRAGADDIAEYLRDHDFNTDVRPAPTGAEWTLLVSCHDAPLPEFIAHMSRVFPSLAKEHGGRYDGWGASLEP